MHLRLLHTGTALACVALLAACGGGGDDGTQEAAITNPTEQQRIAAAESTAQTNDKCSVAALGGFYWEVGDDSGAKASGSIGPDAPAGATALWIFSSSKWLYAANVVQKRGVRDADVPYLNFTSGYTNFGNAPLCSPLAEPTIAGCMEGRDGRNPDTVGKFYYDSGHMQQHAATEMGLADAGVAALADDLNRTIGNFGFEYNVPQPASGVVVSPSGYAQFLRAMLKGDLALGAALGSRKVCADPTVCADAYLAPDVDRPETWYYSLGHWVEDDPDTGDGAFSSPGGGGFYPWIDKDKTHYGIVARQRTIESDAGFHSAECGRLIRQAWRTGVTVTAGIPAP